jgi:hypothetical protein
MKEAATSPRPLHPPPRLLAPESAFLVFLSLATVAIVVLNYWSLPLLPEGGPRPGRPDEATAVPVLPSRCAKERRMSELLYRIRKSGSAWQWEIHTADGQTLAEGTGATDVEARTSAFRAALQAFSAGPSKGQ